ncbi:MAG: hemolysin family protein [Peptococcia bacterium]
MDPDSWIRILFFLMLLFFSSLFSAAEAAVVKLNKYRLKKLAQAQNPRAMLLNRLLEQPGKLFNTILLAESVSIIGTVVLGTSLAIEIWGEVLGKVWAIIILSILVAVLGEISPRAYAVKQPEKVVLNLVRFIYGVMLVLSPLVVMLNKLSNFLLNHNKDDDSEGDISITEQEIFSMVAAGQEEGVIHQEETSMIHGIFEFTDTLVKDVMVPRPDIVAVAQDISLIELVDVIKKEQFSRIPVYDDNIDNIIGVVHIKDIIETLAENNQDFQIKNYLRQPFFVPETKKVNELFKGMQKEKTHMAIVLDEYGSTAGIVTLEDLIEEIMGDIQDEHDKEEPELLNVDDNTVEISGSMRLEELNEELGLDLHCEEAETVGGLVFTELDRVPTEGDQVRIGKLTLTVIEMDGHRIEKIRLTQEEQTEQGEQGETEE